MVRNLTISGWRRTICKWREWWLSNVCYVCRPSGTSYLSTNPVGIFAVLKPCGESCFSIHARLLPVVHLSVHLENGQRVYFTDDNVVDNIQNPPKKNTLIAFFELCSYDMFAQMFLYSEIPSYYVWIDYSFRRKKGCPVPGHLVPTKNEFIRYTLTMRTECLLLSTCASWSAWTDLFWRSKNSVRSSVLTYRQFAELWDCWKTMFIGAAP